MKKFTGLTYFLISSVAILIFSTFCFSDDSKVSFVSNYSSNSSDRSSRFFPFFLGPTIVRFANDPCTGDNGLKGTCLSRHECSSVNGTSSGVCAKGLGCCCIVKRTCGQSTRTNCTYFTNPEYPDVYKGSGDPCTLTIWKCNSKVCQIRLDFIDFNLAEPDATGHCINDFMYVTGAGSTFPRICGLNTGQHAYIDFLGDGPIDINIDINSVVAANRRWKIKITQVKCCDRAPVGCLMYYTSTSGKVMSFNYAMMASTAPEDPAAPGVVGTREIANLNYGVCIQMAPGYCSIEWTQSPTDPYSFTVGPGDASVPTDLVPPALPFVDTCTADFIIIPNPSINGMPAMTDRFCGLGLNPVTSSSKPFVMTVVTNGDEVGDAANRGFCLNFRQLPCAM